MFLIGYPDIAGCIEFRKLGAFRFGLPESHFMEACSDGFGQTFEVIGAFGTCRSCRLPFGIHFAARSHFEISGALRATHRNHCQINFGKQGFFGSHQASKPADWLYLIVFPLKLFCFLLKR